ncbi:polysaccharide deacetylase family protein [Candidatus Poribacteria bacterium]|nr:polysaccharide deacetylase family protein [Candidatus Poribacteria bacterium]
MQGKVANRNFPVLAYHKVDQKLELGVTSISPRRFEKQISFLKDEGYTSLKIQDIVGYYSNSDLSVSENPLLSTRKPILITFDDGYAGVYKYAYPILHKYDFTATIFITTGYVGKNNIWDKSPGPRFKHLNWFQIKDMFANGICFGSHGVNHKFFTTQDHQSLEYELKASKHELEDKLGETIFSLSYPYGCYNDKVIDLTRTMEYKIGFCLRPELLNFGFKYPYSLPRIAVYSLDNMQAFRAKVGDLHPGLLPYRQKIKNLLINRCAYASLLVSWLKP